MRGSTQKLSVVKFKTPVIITIPKLLWDNIGYKLKESLNVVPSMSDSDIVASFARPIYTDYNKLNLLRLGTFLGGRSDLDENNRLSNLRKALDNRASGIEVKPFEAYVFPRRGSVELHAIGGVGGDVNDHYAMVIDGTTTTYAIAEAIIDALGHQRAVLVLGRYIHEYCVNTWTG